MHAAGDMKMPKTTSEVSAGQTQSQKARTLDGCFQRPDVPRRETCELGSQRPTGHGTHPGGCTCPSPPGAAHGKS